MTNEEAIEYIKLIKTCDAKPINEALKMAIEALKQPQIIRCKDCKYWGTGFRGEGCEPPHMDCEQIDGTDAWWLDTKADDYCSRAERKTDRDCENCVHHTPNGCTKWECEFEVKK